MATNEIYKDASYLALPLPLKGSNADLNADPTRNGDPVLIGDLVGVAQEVGGVPVEYTVGSMTVTQARNTANSLEPGWASVALVGAFAIPVTGASSSTPIGSVVNIVAAAGSDPAELQLASGDKAFGHLVGWTKNSPKVPIVRIAQSFDPGGSAAPDTVTNLLANSSGPTATTVTLTWSWAQGSGDPTTGYRVRYRVGTGSWTTVSPNVAAGTFTKVVTGLTAATAYEFEVTALGAEGDAVPVTVNATTLPLAPSAPTALVTNSPAPTASVIVLSWSWTVGSGGPATGYAVRRRTPAGSGTWSAATSVTPSTTKTLTVSGLTASTQYEFEVTAVGAGGSSTALTGTATTSS